MRTIRSQTALLLVVLGLGGFGCGKKTTSIQVFPVTGTVAYRGGGPLHAGTVNFEAVDQSSFSVTGVINEDGTFSLHTLTRDGKLSGVPEGVYRVTIVPPVPEDHKTAVLPVTLNQTFQVAPKENHFQVEVDPRQQRS